MYDVNKQQSEKLTQLTHRFETGEETDTDSKSVNPLAIQAKRLWTDFFLV